MRDDPRLLKHLVHRCMGRRCTLAYHVYIYTLEHESHIINDREFANSQEDCPQRGVKTQAGGRCALGKAVSNEYEVISLTGEQRTTSSVHTYIA